MSNDYAQMGEPRRRGRKSKKQHEKELLKDYNNDFESDREKSIYNQKKVYENYR